MVAEHDDQVVGFMNYELHKTPSACMNFAVRRLSPARRRQPDGRQADRASYRTQRRKRIVLEVRETNLAAQLFFRANGFRAVRCCAGSMTTRPRTPT